MADDAGPLTRLFSGCGAVLVAAGILIVAATLMQPSVETPATIIASEVGPVAAHAAYTVAWLLDLLCLPWLHANVRMEMGRLGLVGLPKRIPRQLSARRLGQLRVPRAGSGQGVGDRDRR